jgi:signal transduction histidine kinase
VVVRDHVVATELFHIAQEAVNNAARHARASHLEMALVQTPDALSLTVRDDGVGLPAERSSNGGMGLRIMRYRAELIGGTLDIRSPQGGGTTIICTVPASELP